MRFLSLLMMAMLSLTIHNICWASSHIGKISQLQGSATVVRSTGKIQTIKMGDTINVGDELRTAANSHVQIHMNDDAYLALRPKSQLRFDNYQLSDDEQSSSILTLFKGSLRAVTGWVGKTNAAHYRVNTPNATLGVRGTDYETLVISKEDANNEQAAGTYNTVYEGQVFVESEGERLEIEHNSASFVPLGQRPQFLAKIPPCLKTALNLMRDWKRLSLSYNSAFNKE
jgi:hypothetical protein